VTAPAAQPPPWPWPQDPRQLPPLQPTIARWRNRSRKVRDRFPHHNSPGYDTKWSKVLAHRGRYEDLFRYGEDHPSDQSARADVDEGPLQKALILCPASGAGGVDVDREHGYTERAFRGVPAIYPGDPQYRPATPERYVPGFLDTRTAALIGRAQALTTRGPDHYHILLDLRAIPIEDWPRQRPIAGADIKTNGFIPFPGSWHYSGERYELTDFGRHGRGYVTAWPELIEAIKADQDDLARARRAGGAHGGGGGGGDGGGHDGEIYSEVSKMVLRGLTRGQCYAEWLKIAIARDPSWQFDEDDFDRHYRSAVRWAEQIRAEEWQGWIESMGWWAK
jgi:hypothetical protein